MRHRIERRQSQPPSAVEQNCQAGIQDRPVHCDGLGIGQTKDVLADGKDRQLPRGLAAASKPVTQRLRKLPQVSA